MSMCFGRAEGSLIGHEGFSPVVVGMQDVSRYGLGPWRTCTEAAPRNWSGYVRSITALLFSDQPSELCHRRLPVEPLLCR